MMDIHSLAFGPIILLALLVFSFIAVVLVAVLFARGRSTSGAPRPTAIPSPAVKRGARVQVLQQLADQHITVDEAEALLTAMGNPVPAAIPTGEPRPSSSGVGCLVAALVGLGLIGLLVVGVLALSFLSYRGAEAEMIQADEAELLRAMHAVTESVTEPTTSIDAEITEETVEDWEEDTR